MKIGICTSEKEVILLAGKVGFDFVEVSNWRVFSDDGMYNNLLSILDELPEGFMYSCNGLIPSDVRLTGPDVDLERVREYASKSFARLASLGVKMLVFGSSGAKRVPEGFSFERAMEQLVEVVRIFSEEAAKHGQRVCIEPLRYSECNIINTLEDSLELARLVDRENVGAHVDYFHLMQNGERLSKLEGAAGRIMHTHIASPCMRNTPGQDDGADYRCFFDYLRRGGYDETVSFEGKFEPTEDELCEMYACLRESSSARS